MIRAGREPAEDVKKRIVAVCQEAGLKVLSARMYLRHDQNNRVILVCASSPDNPFEKVSINIMTVVTLAGNWSGRLDIRCAACDIKSDANFWDIPMMQGRNSVPLEESVEALSKTMEEQEQVIAAMKLGIDDPYRFEKTTWQSPSDNMLF
ncbi:MAG: hypothetical protein ACYTF1_16830 [Planctomycetota bacterium]|jgi:hypothetical protein